MFFDPVGVLCIEQVNETRVWEAEDLIFAQALSDLVSLAYHASKRREYEKNIELLNQSLEARVQERTYELMNQNKQLEEYAFINSHLLRAPLSRILGLVQLVEKSNVTDYDKMILYYLKRASEELDDVIQKINDVLIGNKHFTREDLL